MATKNILIGIGGSGAKGAESFIHLAAAGIGDGSTLLGLIDQDAANGNTDRAKQSAMRYRAVRDHFRGNAQAHELPSGIDLFRPEITLPEDPVWCPLPGEGTTMRNLFVRNMLREELKATMDILFDPEQEQEMTLERGFRGRPNVGAAVVIARAKADNPHPLWKKIKDIVQEAQNGADVRVFLIGSIFGGTGAATFPTVAKLIRDMAGNSPKVKIGGALLLPYFQFPSDQGNAREQSANSSAFLHQTSGALHYYPNLLDNKTLDALYLFGWDELISVRRRPSGGKEQHNPPLLPEVYAGLAAAHFFAAETIEPNRVVRIDRQAQSVSWNSLPSPSERPREVQEKLGQLIRFAAAYLGNYAPFLSQEIKPGFWRKEEAWMKNLITANGITLNDGGIQTVVRDATTFCTELLRWIGGVVFATREGSSTTVKLVDTRQFASWSPDAADPVTVAMPQSGPVRDLLQKEFATLIEGGIGPSLSDIFTGMSNAHKDKAAPPTGAGLGVFFGRLYTLSGFSGYTDDPPMGAPCPLLPHLTAGANVQNTRNAGQWDDTADKRLLISVANHLDFSGKDANSPLAALSVPDVWAQAVVFSNALRESKHPLHEKTLAEWRGLIACLALSPERLATVTGMAFSPTALAASPFEGNGQIAGDKTKGNFGEVLVTALPGDTTFGDADWGHLATLSLNGHPIGLITPSFLVCSARVAPPKGTRISWIRDGRFIDPCTVAAERIGAEELVTIAEYCNNLIGAIRRARINDTDLSNILIGLLEQYGKNARATALTRATGDLAATFDRVSIELPVPNGLDFIKESLRRLKETKTVPSDLRLVLSDRANAVMTQPDTTIVAVLLDPRWGETRTYASDRVWRTVTVAQLNGEGSSLLAQTAQEMAEAGALLVTPDLLFTPVLCQVTTPITSHPEAFRNILLPLTPLAMALFDIDAGSILAKEKDGAGVRIKLALRVINRRGESRQIVLEKHYPEVMQIDPPEVFRWPNLHDDSWPLHLVFTRSFSNSDARIHDVVLPDRMLGSCLTEWEKPKRVARLKALAHTAASQADRFSKMVNTPSVIAELFTLGTPATAIAVDVRAPREGMAQSGGTGTPTVCGGMILMPPVQAPTYIGQSWTVGIDFGTTNTSVYVRAPGNGPRPLPLRCRVGSPLAGEVKASLEEHIEFLPSHDLASPFMTVLWRRTASDETDGDDHPIRAYTLHNVSSPQDTLSHQLGQSSNLHFDIKWRLPQGGDSDPIQNFLAATVLHVVVEAMNEGVKPDSIDWHFSFPQAFHGRKLSHFKTSCTRAIATVSDFFNKLRTNSTTLSLRPPTAWKSESETSALYFVDKKVGFNGTVITLDVGGHTTDVTIWQKNHMLWRNSLELAGRHLLIDYLRCNIDLLEKVVSASPELSSTLTEYYKKLDHRQKPAGIEVIVNSPMFSPFLMKLTRDTNLTLFVEIALCGLAYYIGMVLAYLKGGNSFELQTGHAITLCFAGKASTLFTTMFQELGKEKWLHALLEAGARHKVDSLRTVFSTTPKHEVAYGLLLNANAGDKTLQGGDKPPDRTLVLGESLTAGHPTAPRTLTATNSDSEADLPADEKWRLDPEMPEFSAFLDHIRANLRIKLTLGTHAMAEIRDAIDRTLTDGRARRQDLKTHKIPEDPETSIMSPPFIVAVRRLLELIAEKDSDITIAPV